MTVETKKYEDSVVEKNKIKNWFARQGLPLLSIELRTYKYLPLTDTEIMTEKLQELNRQLNKRTGNLKFIIRITHVVIDCKNWTTWMLKVVNQINFTMLFLSKNILIKKDTYL